MPYCFEVGHFWKNINADLHEKDQSMKISGLSFPKKNQQTKNFKDGNFTDSQFFFRLVLNFIVINY